VNVRKLFRALLKFWKIVQPSRMYRLIQQPQGPRAFLGLANYFGGFPEQASQHRRQKNVLGAGAEVAEPISLSAMRNGLQWLTVVTRWRP